MQQGPLGLHHVGEQLLVDVLLRGRGKPAVEVEDLLELRQAPFSFFNMERAPWSPQASTHSAQPLHLVGSLKIPK
jgi:hypothetical protein